MSVVVMESEVSAGVVVDVYHGVEVIDEFRWLENPRAEQTRAWIEEQSKSSRAYLDNLPGRAALQKALLTSLDAERITEIRQHGEMLCLLKRMQGDEQPKLYRRRGLHGADELLLAPESLGEGSSLSLSLFDISPDGRLIAIGLRTGGWGARRIRFVEIETGTLLPDQIPLGGVRGFSYLPGGHACLYCIEEVGKPQQAKTTKRHFFGIEGEDKIVFYGGKSPSLRLLSGVDSVSGMGLHMTMRAHGSQVLTSIHLQMLAMCGHPVMTLVEDSPDTWSERIHAGYLYLLSDRHDGRGRTMVRLPLGAPDLENAPVVITDEAFEVRAWDFFGEHLVVTRNKGFAVEVDIHQLDGTFLGTVPLPGIGTVNVMAGDAEAFFFEFETYDQPPTVYYYDFAAGTVSHFFGSASRTHTASRRVTYAASDGVEVPLTLVGQAAVLDRGSTPVLLTAYGAAGVSLTPQFSTLANEFIRAGGIFAIAHIRGGGEMGEAWKLAGIRRNRAKVHEDFIAAAEFLGREGIVRVDGLGIAGGSNSGLLVATAMTQRPELFAAVLCIAPFTDMLRYHRYDNTQFYVLQFGSSENAEDFPVLHSYSPFHNVRDGVSYPPLLMVSGDADTRCDPMHARKFVARVQQATEDLHGADKRPILFDWNALRGHSPYLPLTIRARALTDRLAFLFQQLGMEAN